LFTAFFTSASSRCINADDVDGGAGARSLTISAGVISHARTLPNAASIGGRAGVSMLCHGVSPRAVAAAASDAKSAGDPGAVRIPSTPARVENTAATAPRPSGP